MELTEAAVDEFYEMIQGINSSLKKIADILTAITITYRENNPPRGKWFRYEDAETNTWECSVCNEVWQLMDGSPAENGMKYCPMCGAEMTLKDGAAAIKGVIRP